jgi:hypothetical protein
LSAENTEIWTVEASTGNLPDTHRILGFLFVCARFDGDYGRLCFTDKYDGDEVFILAVASATRQNFEIIEIRARITFDFVAKHCWIKPKQRGSICAAGNTFAIRSNYDAAATGVRKGK